MSHEYEIFEIESKPGSSLIRSQQGIFFRDFNQSLTTNDSLIAKDDGISINQINIPKLIDRLDKIVCPGTYSYQVETIKGNTTWIALSKETEESASDLGLKKD